MKNEIKKKIEGFVKIISAPISNSIWKKGYSAYIENGFIRIGQNWYEFNSKWIVE